MITAIPKYWRPILYPLVAAWVIWMYTIDNAFTMGYTSSSQKKLALSIVAVTLTLALILTRTRDGIIVAAIIILIAWCPLALLWYFG